MKNQSRLVKGIVASLLFGLVIGRATFTPATALARQGDEAYTIKRVFIKGEVKFFKLTAALTVSEDGKNEIPLKVTLFVKDATKSLTEEGGAVVRMEFPKGLYDPGSGAVEIPPGLIPSVLMTLDKESHVLKSEKEGEGFGFANPERLIVLAALGFYPTKPVKIGDSWDIEVNDTENKEKRVKIGTATLKGREKRKGIDAFKIQWVADLVRKEGNKERKAHVEAEAFVDIKSGRAVYVKGKTDGELEQGIRKSEVTFEMLSGQEAKELDK